MRGIQSRPRFFLDPSPSLLCSSTCVAKTETCMRFPYLIFRVSVHLASFKEKTRKNCFSRASRRRLNISLSFCSFSPPLSTLPLQQLATTFLPNPSPPSLHFPSLPTVPQTSFEAAAVMILLSMRSQDPSPSRQSNDSYNPSLPARRRDTSPHTSEIRKQVAGAMLSVMPSTRPAAPKRPKLSLQTSTLSSPAAQRSAAVTSLSASTESPTNRNTFANILDAPPPTPTSAIQPQVHFPSSSTTSSAFPGISPFHNDAPYILPIGTHSILRNSPLPRRHVSAASTRAPRRMFPPVKRVAFQERLVEFMPTPVIEGLSDSEVETSSTEDDHKRRREVIEAEDGHSTPIHGRRKRRDWVWRPVEDDALTSHDLVSVGNDAGAPPVQVQVDVINVQPGSGTGKDDVAVRQSSTRESSTRERGSTN